MSLGTSKANYMDPRITVAWCKRCDLAVDTVVSKTLKDKFKWARAAAREAAFSGLDARRGITAQARRRPRLALRGRAHHRLVSRSPTRRYSSNLRGC